MQISLRTLWLAVVLAAVAGCTTNARVSSSSPKEQTTIYVVRHAEKESGSAPGLTPKGQVRADFYSVYFDRIPLAGIYSTDTRRTLATAQPLATSKNINIEKYAGGLDYSEFAKALFNTHSGKNIFVVGHSNTVPLIVNALEGSTKHTDIPHEEYRRLYQVTCAGEGNCSVRSYLIPIEDPQP